MQFCKSQWPKQRPYEYANLGKGCYLSSVIRHQSLSPQDKRVDNPSSFDPIVTRLRDQSTGLRICQYTAPRGLSLALCSSLHWLVRCWILYKQVMDCMLFITRYKSHSYSNINLCCNISVHKEVFSSTSSKEPYVHHLDCQSGNTHINHLWYQWWTRLREQG